MMVDFLLGLIAGWALGVLWVAMVEWFISKLMERGK